MINLENKEIQFAIDAVRQASSLAKMVESELVSSAITKGDRSPVTVADFASQALVGRSIQMAFPGDPLVGEEDSAVLQDPSARHTLDQVTEFVSHFIPRAAPDEVCGWIDNGKADTARRYWTLDPIDGTKGFLRGDQYAVALALVEDGKVQIGVLGCPNLGDAYPAIFDTDNPLIIAVRGQGTWNLSGKDSKSLNQLHVSPCTNSEEARIFRSFEKEHTNVTQIDHFSTELGTKANPVRMDSQAKYAVLAAGQGELLLRLLSPSRPDYKEKIWDQAAGSLVIEEAGGTVTDLHGESLDFTAGRTLRRNRGVIASNGHLHIQALKTLRKVNV